MKTAVLPLSLSLSLPFCTTAGDRRSSPWHSQAHSKHILGVQSTSGYLASAVPTSIDGVAVPREVKRRCSNPSPRCAPDLSTTHDLLSLRKPTQTRTSTRTQPRKTRYPHSLGAGFARVRYGSALQYPQVYPWCSLSHTLSSLPHQPHAKSVPGTSITSHNRCTSPLTIEHS